MAAAVTIQPHRVRLWNGSSWDINDSIRCQAATEGRGMQIGSCSLIQDYGRLRVAGSTASPADVSPTDTPFGALVNVQIYSGSTWGDLWTGVITGEDRSDNGPRMGVQTWHALGIGYLLSKFRCLNGWELSGVATPTDRVGYLPPFNARNGGDRTAATQTVRSSSIYIHDRASQVAKWTAHNALEYILKTQTGYYDFATSTWESSVIWALSDPGNCLTYELPELDLAGASVLDALATIVPTSRGLSWTIGFDTSTMTATVYISSTIPTALEGGTYTLPAATYTTTLDLTGITYRNVRLAKSEESAADVIEIIGNHPLVGVSLNYFPSDADVSSLEVGWESADETAYDNDDPNATIAWSRFTVRGGWLGWQRGSTTVGLSNILDPSPTDDDTHGYGGLTGARSYGGSENAPDARTLVLERELPNSPKFGALVTGARQLPVVLVYDGTTWHDVSNTQSDSLSWQIEVERYPGAINIGNTHDDQSAMKAWLSDADTEIIATVGIRESIPLRVSWRRDPADWPRNDPRVVSVYLPDCELWQTLEGTVTGLDAGAPDVSAADLIIRDDRPRMVSALALMRAYYADPVKVLAWEKVGVIDAGATTAPGVVVTTVTFDLAVETVNTVIDTRTWNFGEVGVSTVYEARPQPPDMRAVR